MSTALGSNSASGAMVSVSPGRARLRACTGAFRGAPRAAARGRAKALPAPPEAGLYSVDEVAGRGGAQPPLDLGPRRQQIGQRDGAEVVAERRAGPRRRRLQRRDARADQDRDALPGGSPPRSSSSSARAAMA